MRPSVYTLEKRINTLLEAQEQTSTLLCESMTIEEQARFLCEYASVICPDEPEPYEAILSFLQEQTGTRDLLTEYQQEIEDLCAPVPGEMGEHRITPTIETPLESDFNSLEIPPQERPAPTSVRVPRSSDNIFRERVLLQRERDGHNPFNSWSH